MTVTRLKPRLRVVEQEPEPFRDYRDSAAYQRTQKLQVEPHTRKQPGQMVLTGKGWERQP